MSGKINTEKTCTFDVDGKEETRNVMNGSEVLGKNLPSTPTYLSLVSFLDPVRIIHSYFILLNN